MERPWYWRLLLCAMGFSCKRQNWDFLAPLSLIFPSVFLRLSLSSTTTLSVELLGGKAKSFDHLKRRNALAVPSESQWSYSVWKILLSLGRHVKFSVLARPLLVCRRMHWLNCFLVKNISLFVKDFCRPLVGRSKSFVRFYCRCRSSNGKFPIAAAGGIRFMIWELWAIGLYWSVSVVRPKKKGTNTPTQGCPRKFGCWVSLFFWKSWVKDWLRCVLS